MNEASISQDEIDRLLKSSAAEKKERPAPKFKSDFFKKYIKTPDEIEEEMTALHVTVTQKEVDDLLNKNPKTL